MNGSGAASANESRTHDPTLRELTADLDWLEKLFTALIDAQAAALAAADKRYEQRFVAQEGAVQSALVGQEKAVSAALAAADRAVTKVETANEKRFESVNEFRSQLADQAAGFLPRSEANIRFDGLSEKFESQRVEIQNLREYRSATAASKDTQHENRAQSNWTIGTTISVVVGLFVAFGIVVDIGLRLAGVH